MCGIFGMFGVPVRPELIGTVQSLLRHRGPDDAGAVEVDGGVLVHRRLSIIDLSPAGHQPMATADRSIWITYNGEIYNYLELRDELASRYRFRTSSDTEVILAAYERWGDDCLPRLRGMFAFGLWDSRRRRLLCATDRLSIKPLLYHVDGARVIFASEAKPIAAAGVSLVPNHRTLYEYLRFGFVNHSEETLFDGILQLRPATCLVYDGGRVELEQYWDLVEQPEEPCTDTQRLDRVDAALQDAVTVHLRSDVEPTLSLSSGLDSNVLRACIQRQPTAPRVKCFTYCFPGTVYDEGVRVHPLVADSDVDMYFTAVHPDRMFERLATLVETLEEPVGGLGIFGYWLNSERVRSEGYKVLLDGQGADEVFAGYKYYCPLHLEALHRTGQFAALDADLAQFNRRHDTAITYPSREFDALVQREVPSSLMRAPDGTSLASDYLSPDFVRSAGDIERSFKLPFTDPVKAAMYRDLFYLKIPKLLRFQDRCAMAWSVEVRVPFLDHPLIEEVFRIPSRHLLAGGLTKALLRKVADERLGIRLDEPKLYVAAPQREWMKQAMRPMTEAMLEDSELARDGYIDAPRLRRQYRDYCESPELGNSFFIWKFVNLELWYRAFITQTLPVKADAIV